MVALAPSDELSVSNPLLAAFTASGGFLADPASLEFQIFNVTDETIAPVQVFPAVAGTRHAVDLMADKISVGHFAAAWSVPMNAALGRYEIRWFLVQDVGSAERRWRRDFDMLALSSDPSIETYALVADVREEGVPATITNRRILEALARGAEQIREWTGHDFTPRSKTLSLDGVEALVLPLNEPICAIESIAFDPESPLDRGGYRVYARHLSQDMNAEDDRDNPRIEFVRMPGWLSYPQTYSTLSPVDIRSPRVSGAQELLVKGAFGYTTREIGGSPVGMTPRPIRRANVLLAMREIYKSGSQAAAAFDAQNGGKIKRQRTREQEIEWDSGKAGDAAAGQYAPFTGDPEIDRILLTYRVALSGTGV